MNGNSGVLGGINGGCMLGHLLLGLHSVVIDPLCEAIGKTEQDVPNSGCCMFNLPRYKTKLGITSTSTLLK